MNKLQIISGIIAVAITWAWMSYPSPVDDVAPPVKRELPSPETYSPSLLEDIPSYPFIDPDLNHITYHGDSTQFQQVFEKLDRMIFEGEGDLSIMHIGGSHVQAGTLSNRMRENLFLLSDGLKGERGFIFPYRLAHTNGPANFKVRYSGDWDGVRCAHKKQHCDWGLSGYCAHTHDTLSHVKIWSFDTDSVNYYFNRVKVFHDMGPDIFSMSLDSGLQSTYVNIDSTVQYTEYELTNWHDTLWLKFEKTDSLQNRFKIKGIQFENDEGGITYHAVGVNGASVPSYLRCENFKEQLSTVMPDLVIFGIGINDAYGPSANFSQRDFEANYDSLIANIRAVNPDAQLLFLTNNDSYYKRRYANKNALKVRAGMLSLAQRHDGAVWDLFNIMGGLNSIKSWENAGLAKRDKVHFTRQGYTLQADMMYHAFHEAYGDYLAARYQSR